MILSHVIQEQNIRDFITSNINNDFNSLVENIYTDIYNYNISTVQDYLEYFTEQENIEDIHEDIVSFSENDTLIFLDAVSQLSSATTLSPEDKYTILKDSYELVMDDLAEGAYEALKRKASSNNTNENERKTAQKMLDKENQKRKANTTLGRAEKAKEKMDKWKSEKKANEKPKGLGRRIVDNIKGKWSGLKKKVKYSEYMRNRRAIKGKEKSSGTSREGIMQRFGTLQTARLSGADKRLNKSGAGENKKQYKKDKSKMKWAERGNKWAGGQAGNVQVGIKDFRSVEKRMGEHGKKMRGAGQHGTVAKSKFRKR